MENTLNINEIVEVLAGTVLQGITTPKDIPSPIIALGAKTKNGITASEVTKRIISRKGEAGAPVGALPDGSDS